jgi:segregation and condensation protein A
VYEPQQLGEALGALLRVPPEPDTSHIRPTVSLERRLGILRALLSRRGSFDFDEVFAEEDRLTQAVTLFALLEMHKRGEASWQQRELFGPIEVSAAHGN